MQADCLQPGGIAKERAKHNVWAKGIAPSDGLRPWLHREPEKPALLPFGLCLSAGDAALRCAA